MNDIYSLIAGLILMSATALAQRPTPIFKVGAPKSIWTLQDRLNDGLFYYPDMPIGVIRTRNDSGYLFFAPGSGKNTVTQPTGVYVSTGSLDQFAPAKKGPNGPEPSMTLGQLQPAPDGDYDRDYAGGGPTYVLNAPGYRLRGVTEKPDIAGSPILLQLYHGEYHPNAPSGQPFYGVSALAVSYDYANSFTKIGEILSPQSTLEETTQLGVSVTADGSLVEADENGNPIEGRDANLENVYIYSVFSDRAAPTSPSGFSIARVKKSDFINAILSKKAPLFQKYYNPRHTSSSSSTCKPPSSRDGFFTEPGIGGCSTFIVTEPGNYIATPQVHYDRYLHQFILVYPQNQNTVWIRTANNLFNWSSPRLLYAVSDSGSKVFYASAVGAGDDPTILGGMFYVYFVTGEVVGYPNVWAGPNGTLMREKVEIRR